MNRDERRTAALLVERWDSWERRHARLLERIRDVDEIIQAKLEKTKVKHPAPTESRPLTADIPAEETP